MSIPGVYRYLCDTAFYGMGNQPIRAREINQVCDNNAYNFGTKLELMYVYPCYARYCILCLNLNIQREEPSFYFQTGELGVLGENLYALNNVSWIFTTILLPLFCEPNVCMCLSYC